MEDSVSVRISIDSGRMFDFAGIFDGHNGREAALYLAQHMYRSSASSFAFFALFLFLFFIYVLACVYAGILTCTCCLICVVRTSLSQFLAGTRWWRIT